MSEFDKLPDRNKFGSNRRADLLVHLLKKGREKVFWMYSYEVEVESFLKRKVGYSEWDKNWDIGLHLLSDKIYLLLSKRNNLGSFEVIEKVEYTKDLNPTSWISDSLTLHRER